MSEETVNPDRLPGWFGKMPSLGDFASRRLPPMFVNGWDAWLQHEMVRSRAALGGGWLDAFLVAPVRRFWLAPGLLGTPAWVGVWMPSVDRVGRHFPFAIASAIDGGLDGRTVAATDAPWFDAVEAAARSVLDPQCEVDDLEQTLLALPPWSALLGPSAGPPPRRRPPPVSLWWCAGAGDVASCLVCPGLPAGEHFDRLLQPCP